MNKEQVIPPGIVAFKDHSLNLQRVEDRMKHWGYNYERWVRIHLSEPKPATIHTISVDGKEWSVEEDVDCNMGGGIIKELRYIEGNWVAFMEVHHNGTTQLNRVSNIRKKSKPTPSSLDRSGSQPGEEDLIEGYVNLMKSMLLCIPKGTHEDSKFLWQIEIDRLEELRSQPSQPGDGKEEVFKKLDKRLEALEHYLSSEAFGELANGASKAQSVVFLLKQDLHSLLKSKPTDGWSDEHEKEFDSWMWNNGYINNHRKLMLFGIREFKKWLSSYKQTKQ